MKHTLVFEDDIREGINGPDKSLIHFKSIQNKSQETFVVLLLDGSHKLISKKIISVGLVNKTLVHPREVFREAIKKNAVAVIIGHNHPSGNITPSIEDNEITKRMKQAGEILGITVLDHIIISKTGYYSYLEKGVF